MLIYNGKFACVHAIQSESLQDVVIAVCSGVAVAFCERVVCLRRCFCWCCSPLCLLGSRMHYAWQSWHALHLIVVSCLKLFCSAIGQFCSRVHLLFSVLYWCRKMAKWLDPKLEVTVFTMHCVVWFSFTVGICTYAMNGFLLAFVLVPQCLCIRKSRIYYTIKHLYQSACCPQTQLKYATTCGTLGTIQQIKDMLTAQARLDMIRKILVANKLRLVQRADSRLIKRLELSHKLTAFL
jgi:hypothetical protein